MSIPHHEPQEPGREHPRSREEVLAEARPFDWDAWQALGDDLSDDEREAFLAAVCEA